LDRRVSTRVTAGAQVAGRGVFYNDSVFDGNDAAANAADDGAVAPDKQALLPGGGATFANFTSYLKGINGLVVDVAGLGDAAGLSAADFAFAAGVAVGPNDWPAVAVTPAVTVRPGAGVGGSDRVEVTFPDGGLTNQWLRVTVLATARTGLAAPDVFYVGNLIGDANGNGQVTVADLGLTKLANGQAADLASTTRGGSKSCPRFRFANTSRRSWPG
jgi:hypothetical protein